MRPNCSAENLVQVAIAFAFELADRHFLVAVVSFAVWLHFRSTVYTIRSLICILRRSNGSSFVKSTTEAYTTEQLGLRKKRMFRNTDDAIIAAMGSCARKFKADNSSLQRQLDTKQRRIDADQFVELLLLTSQTVF